MASGSAQPLDTEDDIDAETIQSTVDMSLSLALNLVQSWMPSSSSSVDPSIAESRKKLEEYMRRPPRLGVGAPVPTAQNQSGGAVAHHETQRLKNRLVGSGAARKRTEDARINGVGHLGSKLGSGGHKESDEDESESRASAMKKGKTANAKPNGLSVFGSTTTTKAGPKVQAAIPVKTTIPHSAADDSSSTPSLETAPKPAPSQLGEEPMGVHTLPPKLSLAAKIWPRTTVVQSPTDSDRQTKRRKVAPMLPPSVPDVAWNSQLPQLPLSRSGSTASVTSSASSRDGVDRSAEEHGQTSSGSTAQLSRKELKRLRREAAQQSASRESQIQSALGVRTERDTGPETKAQSFDDRDTHQSGAQGETDDSDGRGESEGVSQIRENGASEKASDENDTVQGGKKKRKRRVKKKTGPSI